MEAASSLRGHWRAEGPLTVLTLVDVSLLCELKDRIYQYTLNIDKSLLIVMYVCVDSINSYNCYYFFFMSLMSLFSSRNAIFQFTLPL